MEPLPHWSLSVGKISHGTNCQQSNGTDCGFLGLLMHFRLHIANFQWSYLRGSLVFINQVYDNLLRGGAREGDTLEIPCPTQATITITHPIFQAVL